MKKPGLFPEPGKTTQPGAHIKRRVGPYLLFAWANPTISRITTQMKMKIALKASIMA